MIEPLEQIGGCRADGQARHDSTSASTRNGSGSPVPLVNRTNATKTIWIPVLSLDSSKGRDHHRIAHDPRNQHGPDDHEIAEDRQDHQPERHGADYAERDEDRGSAVPCRRADRSPRQVRCAYRNAWRCSHQLRPTSRLSQKPRTPNSTHSSRCTTRPTARGRTGRS